MIGKVPVLFYTERDVTVHKIWRNAMSRLTIMTATKAQRVIEDLYKDLERRIIAKIGRAHV